MDGVGGTGSFGLDWHKRTRAVPADNDAAYVVASMATTTTIINAGAIVRVWAVNKNNCLLLHFAFRPFRQLRECVCV